MDNLTEFYGEPVYVYSRADAISDGFLVDVSQMAKEAGFRCPVAVTRTVWETYVVPDERARLRGQSEQGRLWDILWLLREAIRTHGKTFLFQVYFIMKEKQIQLVTLKSICGPGDTPDPVITIMLPDED